MTDYSGSVINLMTKSQYDSATKVNTELYAVRSEVVIETYVSGTSGYRIWSDGYCEQWGRLSTTSTNVEETVSLLKTFSNTNYYVNVTSNCDSTSYGSTQPNCVRTRTTSTFVAHVDSYAPKGTGGDWIACGYLAAGQY